MSEQIKLMTYYVNPSFTEEQKADLLNNLIRELFDTDLVKINPTAYGYQINITIKREEVDDFEVNYDF